jgi:hypothetical protein
MNKNQAIQPTLATHTRGNKMPHIQAPQIDHNALFDTAYVAAMLSQSTVTLVNARSLGTSPIPYTKIGRLIRYRYGDILSYLESLPKFTQ